MNVHFIQCQRQWKTSTQVKSVSTYYHVYSSFTVLKLEEVSQGLVKTLKSPFPPLYDQGSVGWGPRIHISWVLILLVQASLENHWSSLYLLNEYMLYFL